MGWTYVCRNCALLRHRPRTQIQKYSTSGYARVLGIETSCDETGAAIVDTQGQIQGESLQSQKYNHIRFGGILPPLAIKWHEQNIDHVIQQAFQSSNLTIQDVDAVAVTNMPGLASCLKVGVNAAVALCRQSGKPLIPIHHMQAHALTIRMVKPDLQFPFLSLLVSGGHCILTWIQGVDDFQVLGQTLDTAPGEALDKIARRLRLYHIGGEYEELSGGQAIEQMAQEGDPLAYNFGSAMAQHPNCNFSFSGLKTFMMFKIARLEAELGLRGGKRLPQLPDFCASVQHTFLKHIAKRVQRAIEFIEVRGTVGQSEKHRHFVVSGGVACNQYFRQHLSRLAEHYQFETHFPPPHLCTDNGVMIAWNGVERWRAQTSGILRNLSSTSDAQQNLDSLDPVVVEPQAPMGPDLTQKIEAMGLKIAKKISMNKLVKGTEDILLEDVEETEASLSSEDKLILKQAKAQLQQNN